VTTSPTRCKMYVMHVLTVSSRLRLPDIRPNQGAYHGFRGFSSSTPIRGVAAGHLHGRRACACAARRGAAFGAFPFSSFRKFPALFHFERSNHQSKECRKTGVRSKSTDKISNPKCVMHKKGCDRFLASSDALPVYRPYPHRALAQALAPIPILTARVWNVSAKDPSYFALLAM